MASETNATSLSAVGKAYQLCIKGKSTPELPSPESDNSSTSREKWCFLGCKCRLQSMELMAIEGKRGSSSPSPWNCRLPSEAISFNSEYSLPFSPLTMGPEKAGDICQTQMAHLENDCVSVYKESDRVNREGLDIYVHGKPLIFATTTWTHSQLHWRQDQRAAAPRATFREGETMGLNCSSLHRQGLATL